MSSRIVVKNLPRSVTAEQLKAKFAEKGTVTDVQLKYTPEGKFRRFAFIGYHREDQAKAALDYFNNSFVFNSRIKVEICSNLGDTNKPKSWSKYAPDSFAYQKLHNIEPTQDFNKEKLPSKKENKKSKQKTSDPLLNELVEKHKDDPTFSDFLQLHGKNVSQILPASNDEDETEDTEEGDESSTNQIAHADISDMEYLKLKAQSSQEDVKQESVAPKIVSHKRQYHTIVVKNLPPGVKKKDLKAYFKPLPLASVRVPQGFLGMAYIGFKDEKNCNKALNKNKSFWQNKQLNIYKYSKDNSALYNNQSNNDTNNNKEDNKEKQWKQQEDSVKNAEDIAESGRIFVRNLSYMVTEDDLTKQFEKYGPLAEVILPIDKETEKTKGFALVTYVMPEHAALSYQNLDGTVFLGRMLHLIPGKPKENEGYGGGSSLNEGSSFKTAKAKTLKKSAGHVHTWNSLFLGTNAIAEAMAEAYNASKADILSGSGAATRLAMGETEIVEKTRTFLEENGVRLDAFNQVVEARSKTVILVKNLPYKTSPDELKALFEPFGDLGRVLIPPYGITGLVEFLHKAGAKAAFNALAYTKFKETPLYLEWAPDGTFIGQKENKKKKTKEEEGAEEEGGDVKVKEEEEEEEGEKETNEELEEEREPEPDTTLYIKNLNFNSTEESIRKHFSKCGPIASVTIARKKDPKNPGEFLSMGYGFVQYYSQQSTNRALKDLQNSSLDDHQVELKRSNKNLDSETPSGQERRKASNVAKQTGSKILVRNIPFQAKQEEVEELFKAFGDIKFVRLPKKMVGSGVHRGFGFVEYMTKNEAKRAMKALCQSTHLYGRRLVLEWADQDENNVDELRKRTNRYFGTDAPGGKKSKKGIADIDVDQYAMEADE
uniref:Probable RNA-binding protein 19 n=1 Tax=Cacopsylla melanoneura TaxID=428564 RepID=A0A8D8PPT4_9HEMI